VTPADRTGRLRTRPVAATTDAMSPGTDDSPPPAAAGAAAPTWTVGRTARALAAGGGVALVFASGRVRDWAFDLPLAFGPVRGSLFAAADTWHAWMVALGAARLQDWLRTVVEALRFG